MVRTTVTTVLALAVLASAAFGQVYEAHYLFRGGYPIAPTAWSHRVEGVAHDDDYWYFSMSRVPTTLAFHAIWKVPVGLDLLTVTGTTPGVTRLLVTNTHPLFDFHSFGDSDVYRFNGIDYLVVPLSRGGGCVTQPASVAFFRCDTLALVGHAPLPGLPCGAAWIAVSDAGELYTSYDHIGLPDPAQRGLRVYNVNWESLATPDPLIVTFNRNIPMWNENGQPLELFHMQGGEFAPGDQLLYLSSGFVNDDNDTADREGIHVIDTTTFQRVRHSSRGVAGQLFDFYYNPGSGSNEQPQGLTLWDLDNGRAPGIKGQLHLLVAENFFESVDFKHYTRALSVNGNWSGCQTGTPNCPFPTILAALPRAWSGSEVRIRAGAYPETMVINKRVRLTAEGGLVRIGGT
jgi:hypothetical protein